MRKTLFASVVSAMCGMLFFASSAFAGTITTVSGTVVSPTAEPVEGMAVQLFQGDTQYSYATTDSSGLFTFTYLADGDYTLVFAPSMSYECGACGLYNELTESITVDSETYGLDEQPLGEFAMEAAERYVTITVVDQEATPVEGATVNAWSDSSYAYGTTDSSGQYAFAWDADIISFGVYPSDGGFASTYQYDLPVEETGETAIEAEVQTTDASIVINLKDSDGNAYALTEEEYASVYCTETSETGHIGATGDGGTAASGGGAYFYDNIIGGESSATVGVIAGTYTCGAWVQGYGVHMESGTVTVAAEESESINATLLAYDATINFAYVDTDGNPITDIASLSVYGSSTKDANGDDYYGDYIWAQGEDGQATLEALDGFTYDIGSWFDSSSNVSGGDSSEHSGDDSGDHGDFEDMGVYITSEGKHYIQNYKTSTIVADAENPQTVQVVLEEADATLEVTLLDSNGDPSPYGWVSASESSGLSDKVDMEGSYDWSNYVGGMTDENGVATLALVSGTDYTVSAYTGTSHDGTALPPPHQNVKLESGATEAITMQEGVVDWTLNITTTDGTEIASEGGSFDYSYCYGYSPSLGMETFAEMNGNTGTMGLVRGGEWYIGCMAYVDDVFYRSADTVYTPGDENGGSGDLTMELQNAGDYYGETSYSVSATSTTTITLPDGVSTLTIPANAISDTGTLTLTVKTATGYAVNDKQFPVAAYEFSVLDENGETVTDFAENLTLKLAYDEDQLAEWGIDESTLTGGAYGDNNDWQSPVSTTVDTEGNFLVITLNHFSAYAAIGDRGVTADVAPSKARNLVSRKIKAHRALLDWKKPSEGTVTSYTVQVRKFHVKKKSKYRKFTGITATQRRVKKLKANTRYEFRVRACNASSCSAFTKWNDFTTKE